MQRCRESKGIHPLEDPNEAFLLRLRIYDHLIA